MIWHSTPIEAVETELAANVKSGLSQNAAENKLKESGPNRLSAKKSKSIIKRFFDQFKDFMIIILIAAAFISFLASIISNPVGQHSIWESLTEPLVILGIVIVNAIMGTVQEAKAEKSLEALKSMSAPSAKVIRGGILKVISASELVPGDLIFVEAGDYISADARIIESHLFRCDESALTGENIPIEKDENAEITDIAPLGDRKNMIYSGTAVVNGNAKAIVTETGMNTEIGKIATLLEEAKDELTPLQKRLATLGKQLGAVAIVICILVFILSAIINIFSHNTTLLDAFMTSVALAVAAIPEGMPAVVTIVLALGVTRMVKKNAIVRNLPSVETLGSTSVICSDKTGTLTQNKMTVVSAYTENDGFVKSFSELSENAVTLLRFSAICCDAKIDKVNDKLVEVGDPTELALVMAGMKYTGVDKNSLENIYPRLAEIPFDSDRKLMTTVNMIAGKPVAIVKGAPDILFSRCSDINHEAAKKANDIMTGKALRSLAICYKPLSAIPTNPSSNELENNLTFLGLVGLMDPPREEVKVSIKECKSAGITPVMITGDHIETAKAIATSLGIMDDNSIAITGEELSNMDNDELALKLKSIRVYARVTPEDKIRIVDAWQNLGEIVAMTGDGVNDAPALKAANIGCAMGITGTDVAKGAADMVLTDDNFATIVSAVKEGRSIYANIQKAISFLVGCNVGEILCVFLAMCFWQTSPLLAMQILWVNLVTDGFSALALGMEPGGYDLMLRPPINKKENIVNRNVLQNILISGITITVITLIAYGIGRGTGKEVAQTMTFAVLAFSQLVNSYNSRSSHSIFRIGIFKNMYINLSFLAGVALTLLILLTPAKGFFGLVALSANQWITVVLLSLVPLVAFETYKLIIFLKTIKH